MSDPIALKKGTFVKLVKYSPGLGIDRDTVGYLTSDTEYIIRGRYKIHVVMVKFPKFHEPIMLSVAALKPLPDVEAEWYEDDTKKNTQQKLLTKGGYNPPLLLTEEK